MSWITLVGGLALRLREEYSNFNCLCGTWICFLDTFKLLCKLCLYCWAAVETHLKSQLMLFYIYLYIQLYI